VVLSNALTARRYITKLGIEKGGVHCNISYYLNKYHRDFSGVFVVDLDLDISYYIDLGHVLA